MTVAGPSYIISKLCTISALKNHCVDNLNLDENISNDLVSSLFILYGYIGKLLGPSYGGFINDLFGFNASCNILILIITIVIICLYFFTDSEFILKNNKRFTETFNLDFNNNNYLNDSCSTQIFLTRKQSKKSVINAFLDKNNFFEYKNDHNNFSEIVILSSNSSFIISNQITDRSESLNIYQKNKFKDFL